MKWTPVVTSAAVAIFFFANHAAADVPCAKREQVMQQLRSGYAEVPVGRGITGSGGLIELFVSEETGTWTVVVTAPQQVSCMIAAGEGWERMAPIPVIPDMPVTFRPHAY